MREPLERAGFGLLWRSSTAQTRWQTRRAHKHLVIGIPQHLTTVVRLDPGLARRLQERLRVVVATESGIYLYPPNTMHVTIRNLDGLGRIGMSKQEMLVLAQRACQGVGAFRLVLRGFNLSPETVFAQAYSTNGELSTLRRSIDRTLGLRHRAGRGSLARRLAFANVARVPEGVPSSRLIEAVRSERMTEFGDFVVHEIEIVRTDKVLSDKGTEQLLTIPLGGEALPR